MVQWGGLAVLKTAAAQSPLLMKGYSKGEWVHNKHPFH